MQSLESSHDIVNVTYNRVALWYHEKIYFKYFSPYKSIFRHYPSVCYQSVTIFRWYGSSNICSCLLLYCERNRIQWAWEIAGVWLGSAAAVKVTVYDSTISARGRWSSVCWYCIFICICMHMHIDMHMHIHIHIHIYIDIDIDICICMCVYVYIYIYIYTYHYLYTEIHTTIIDIHNSNINSHIRLIRLHAPRAVHEQMLG